MEPKTTNLILDDFLAAFFADENETINLRIFKPKGAPDSFSEKIPTTRNQLLSDLELQQRLQSLNKRNGVYFVVNSGGNSDDEIRRYNAFFADFDDGLLDEQKAILAAAPITPSIRTLAKRGYHAYWLCEGDCSETEWREIQNRLIAYFGSDKNIKNPSRVMRLPFFNHVTYNEDRTLDYQYVEVVEFSPARRYTVAEMKERFPVPETAWEAAAMEGSPTPDFSTWAGLNMETRRRLLAIRPIKYSSSGEWAHVKGICHNGRGDTGIFISLVSNAYGCMKEPDKCSTANIRRAVGVPENPIARPINPQSATSGVSTVAADDGWIRASDVTPEEVKWLWYPYVALGKLTLFDGDPGCGKSLATCAVAAAVSRGHKLEGAKPLSDEGIEPRKVLMMSAEDGLADTLRPRLDSLNADVSKIILREKALTLNAAGLSQLEAAIGQEKPAVVIIDPLFAFVGGIDIYRDNEARSITTPIADMAQKYGCAIVAIRHLTKQQQKDIYSGSGSMGFIGAARSALLFGCNPDNQDERVIVHIKSNLSEKGASIGYEIAEGDDGKVKFEWLGGREITAEQILAYASPTNKAITTRQRIRSTITREMSKGEIRKANPEIKERTFERHLSVAVRDGFIYQPRKGFYAPLSSKQMPDDSAAATAVSVMAEVDGGKKAAYLYPQRPPQYELEERKAIMEFDGGMTPEGADYYSQFKSAGELKTMQLFRGRVTPKPQPLLVRALPTLKPEIVPQVYCDGERLDSDGILRN